MSTTFINNEQHNKYLEEKQIIEQEKQIMEQKIQKIEQEKQIMEQEIQKIEQEKQIMEQEMNEKKQQLQDNNIKISDLKKSKKFLKRGLDKYEKMSKSKIEENDGLKNEIRKLKELNKMFTRLPIMTQDVKKRDNKARTFVPPDNTTNSTKTIDFLKRADKDEEELKLPYKLFSDKTEIPKDVDINKLLGNINKYVNINLSNANNLIDEMKKNLEKEIIFGNNKSINFNDILNFLQNIIDGEVNNFNKQEKCNEKF